jgi:hypothetical protein
MSGSVDELTVEQELGLLLEQVPVLLRELVGIASFGERFSTLDSPEVVELEAGEPTAWDYGGLFASLAIVNPNAFTVYVGYGARDGVAGRELVAVPGGGWIVLPFRGRRLSLGAGANAGQVYLLPLKQAQPFAAGTTGTTAGGSSSMSTVSKVALTGASQTLLDANGGRLHANIYNDAATSLYVKLGAAAGLDDWTAKLAQDDNLVIPAGYTGPVTAISAAATGQARVTELA